MNPHQAEQAKKQVQLVEVILEGIKALKEYQLEIIKGQRAIREDLRNIENLKPLKEGVKETA